MSDEEEKKDDVSGMSGPRRAAALLLTLDSETAASVMRNLSEQEVAAITEEMSRMGSITGEQMEAVVEAYRKQAGSGTLQVEPLLEELLEKALGREKAKSMINRIRSASRDSEPFRSLRHLQSPAGDRDVEGRASAGGGFGGYSLGP